MLGKTVKDFYSAFDFEKMLVDSPKEIQDFLIGEIEFIKNLSKTGKILEVGCGYGRLLKILSEKAEEVIGVDFSKQLLEKAKENLEGFSNVKLQEMDAQNLLFANNSFNYVVCLDNTFGNMPGIEDKVISEMKRVVKKGGKVIISVFSDLAKGVQLENYSRIGLLGIKDTGNAVVTDNGFYSRRFSKKELEDLFESAGLKPTISSVCPVNYLALATK